MTEQVTDRGQRQNTKTHINIIRGSFFHCYRAVKQKRNPVLVVTLDLSLAISCTVSTLYGNKCNYMQLFFLLNMSQVNQMAIHLLCMIITLVQQHPVVFLVASCFVKQTQQF